MAPAGSEKPRAELDVLIIIVAAAAGSNNTDDSYFGLQVSLCFHMQSGNCNGPSPGAERSDLVTLHTIAVVSLMPFI